jgi:6-phosphofructokinase 1
VQNGIALVKVMGRHAGFLAAGATVASQDVNFTLIPELPFKLEGQNGFLPALERRLLKRGHAVVVVAEGAGQDLFDASSQERDASGNSKLKDIGVLLRKRIEEWFKSREIPIVLRYFDPSYFVRSSPANSEDSIVCDMFARNAVHAAMAGATGVVIGYLHDRFIHVPIEALAKQKKTFGPGRACLERCAGSNRATSSIRVTFLWCTVTGCPHERSYANNARFQSAVLLDEKVHQKTLFRYLP